MDIVKKYITGIRKRSNAVEYKICNSFGFEVFFSLLVLLLLNLPFWILNLSFFVMRPLFNVDLILVAFVCVFSARIGMVLLPFIWALDYILVASFSYYFTSVSDFISSFHFANTLDLLHFFTPLLLGIVCLFLINGGLAIYSVRKFCVTVRGLFIWSLVICLFDVINGSTQAFGFGQDHFYVPYNIAGSPSWNLGIARSRANDNLSLPLAHAEQSLAFDTMGRWRKAHPGGSILVIIVESMGRPLSPILQAWLEQQIFTPSVKSRWLTMSDIEPFYGATTSGELRVLCGLSGSYVRLTKVGATNCLPVRSNIDGYTTTGIHGFTSQMFDRHKWWPILGLNSRLFSEQLAPHARLCGDAFPGLCDNDLVVKAVKQADSANQFVYLLTLNTHLPLGYSKMPSDLQVLCRKASAGESACQLVLQLGNLLKVVANSLEDVNQPPFVTIVGDHAPPFATLGSRSSFDQSYVPVYFLQPL